MCAGSRQAVFKTPSRETWGGGIIKIGDTMVPPYRRRLHPLGYFFFCTILFDSTKTTHMWDWLGLWESERQSPTEGMIGFGLKLMIRSWPRMRDSEEQSGLSFACSRFLTICQVLQVQGLEMQGSSGTLKLICGPALELSWDFWKNPFPVSHERRLPELSNTHVAFRSFETDFGSRICGIWRIRVFAGMRSPRIDAERFVFCWGYHASIAKECLRAFACLKGSLKPN